MAWEWSASVKRGGKLRVFATPSAQQYYLQPIRQAISWFNAQKLRAELLETKSEADCHIRIEARDGAVVGGSQNDEILKDCVGGKYFAEGDKAWIFVPTTPMVQQQVATARGDYQLVRRVVGDGIKLVMIAHELLHCAGLDDADHTPPQHADVFTGELNWVPEAGDFPTHDKMSLNGQVGVHLRMPPLVLHPKTKQTLISLWT